MSDTIINNTNTPVHRPSVYVYAHLPKACPFDDNPLEPKVTVTPKGKSIDFSYDRCKYCKKDFVTLDYYLKNRDYLITLNPERIPVLLAERKAEIEAKQKQREKTQLREKARQEKLAAEAKKHEELERQKALQKAEKEKKEKQKIQEKKDELFWIISPSRLGFDAQSIRAFRSAWMELDLSLQDLNILTFAFFVRNKSGALSCVLLSKQRHPKKCNVKGIYIISAKSKLANKLHTYYIGNKKDSSIEVVERVKLTKKVKEPDFQENHPAEQTNKSNQIPYSYEGIKTVYVYFSLTNACMKYKHEIETVTAQTTNAKNGTSISVNVFHCKTCDKYFINYEALQKYISRGVYPALPYAFSRDLSGSLHDASKLMLYGYRVADGTLTTIERRAVLSWIIDSGLLTKSEIIKDLQFKVRYNGSKAGNERARQKWLDDIQFVSQYVGDNKRKIKAVFVVRNKK